MTNRELLNDLRSGDWHRITNALSWISGSAEWQPSSEVLDETVSLVDHIDDEIQHGAVRAAGLRWQRPGVFQKLCSILIGIRAKEHVAEVVARAIGAMGATHADLRREALMALANAVLNERFSPELRGVAYLAARHAARLATAKERAESIENINELPVDWDWIRKCAAG